jgi:RNA polymerase sigma factor (sigma-70 family)
LQAQELQDLLHEKIRLLPERQREVMQLHGEKALGYREIAQILGCSYEDVKMNLCLARKRLRQDMGAYL